MNNRGIEFMRYFLLVTASLIISTTAAMAAPITSFGFIGSIVQFTVADTGTYQIVAYGAQGGKDNAGNGAAVGNGAKIGGTFSLNFGDVLKIAVGGAGQAGAWAGGGGGGTFVYDQTIMQALVIAGGGGGGWATGFPGADASLTASGSGGGGNAFSDGGGGGGGGLTGNGSSSSQGTGGYSAINGLQGGMGTNGGAGGFGGGGGGGPNNSGTSGGGGGGGYSGGNAGHASGGLGGSSYNSGIDQLAQLSGSQYAGNGYATITELTSVPEPVSSALLGIGIAGMALVRRRAGRS